MPEVKEVEQLAKLIDSIARFCWRGLPSLVGEAPKPTREQMKSAVFFRPRGEVVKTRGGKSSLEGAEIKLEDAFIDNIDPILEEVPWEKIVESVKWYIQTNPDDWKLYTTLVCNVGIFRSGWGKVSVAEQMACKYKLSVQTVYAIARSVPVSIAKAASMGVCDLSLLKF